MRDGGRPADRLRPQAPHRAARHARALPGRAAQRDRERASAVHPSQHAAPAPGADRGADRAAARPRTTCCRSSWRSSSRGCTGGPTRPRPPPRRLTPALTRRRPTRNTGTFARAAHALGLLGPQHVADDAVAVRVGRHHDRVAALARRPPRRSAWSPCACPSTWPSASMPLRSQPLDRLGDDLALLLPLALGRQQPGWASRTTTPWTRAIENTCTLAPERSRARPTRSIAASGIAPALGGEQDPLERPARLAALSDRSVLAAALTGRRRRPAPAHRRRRRRRALGPRSSLAPPVQRQVGEQHADPDEVVRERLAPGRVARAARRTPVRRRSR